jgi:hypothetical protein
VKGRTLAVFVVVGLAVVGWAVFALVGGEDREPRATKTASSRTAGSDADAEPKRRPAGEPAPREAKRDAEPSKERTAKPPPEVPKPNITLEEAREQYDAYIAELDREIAKTEETGRPLANEAWVEYYKRGHEAMDPLRRLLDPKDPANQKEVSEKYEVVRNKLRELEPRPNAP